VTKPALTVVATAILFGFLGCGRSKDESGRSQEPVPERPLVLAPTPEERLAAITRLAAPGHTITAYEVTVLRDQGLPDPIPNLVEDLRRHHELIPHRGTHGKTLRFYGDDAIRILGRGWALGTFEDGHVGGRGIFAYEVLPDSSIAWKLLFSQMD
jgi:hypothetical protein